MKKKIVAVLFLVNVVFLSFGQENRITPLNWEEWNEEVPKQYDKYAIGWEIISPSLSYVREFNPSTYQLMEIDLTKDLRRQAYQSKTPLLITPENKFVITKFSLASPVAPKSAVIITGRRRLDYSVNRGVKNTVYKDASFYTGTCNPFTGLPY